MENKNYSLPLSIVIVGAFFAGAWMYTATLKSEGGFEKVVDSEKRTTNISNMSKEQRQVLALEKQVLPERGIVLPVKWGNLGAQLVDSGVIDGERFKALYNERGAFTKEYAQLLSGEENNNIFAKKTGLKITKDNAGYLLNLFWALGLANKNPILDDGEMVNPAYGGAGNFASTGGWTMAVGSGMEHYSMHPFITLTPEQQNLVDKVSRGIYRPCCGNSVNFPDCNHGMAMLGLLELMASEGVSEQEMWDTALTVNSYWFPDTYLTLATYMQSKSIDWKDVNPQEILGAEFSSAQGYANIRSQVTIPSKTQSGGGCGVDTGAPASTPALKQQSGCGV